MSRLASQSIVNNRNHALGSAYPVTLPAFEGPLDLLLQLIEREELDVSEISLLAVTDQYLETLELLEEIEPGALADFLMIASRLLFIKSNRLLPSPPKPEEDEDDVGDNLIQRLVEYRQFKEAAASLKQREDLGVRAFVRLTPPAERDALLQRTPDLSNLDLSGLHAALQRALMRVPIDQPPMDVQPYQVTVAERIEAVRLFVRTALYARISGSKSVPVTFSAILGQANSRVEVVVTFLAVLELVKQDELRAVQVDTFGEIVLEPVEESDYAVSAAAEIDQAGDGDFGTERKLESSIANLGN